MKLSVIIPCYNGAETLGQQLEALSKETWKEPWEVIVADNGSTDSSLEIVEEYQRKMPNLRTVSASARRGQPFALNTGAEAARAESLAFCDADDVVGEGWVAAIGEALVSHCFVASKFEFRRLNSASTVRSRPNGQCVGLQVYTTPPFLPHAGGCGLGVRKSLFRDADGFDESLPALHDTDLCWRLQLQGVELVFVPDALMHVRFRDTFSGVFHQARTYGEFNVLLYKRYRTRGMPVLARHHAIRGWLSLLVCLPRLWNETARLLWARQFGRRIGRLQGCLKYRILAP